MQTRPVPAIEPGRADAAQSVLISVVVPVLDRYDDLERLYREFAREISSITDSYEFLFVVYHSQVRALSLLSRLMASDPRLRLFRFSSHPGEAAALAAGFSKARGEFLFTLAPDFQVQPEALHSMLQALRQDADLVIPRRSPTSESRVHRLFSFLFHGIVSRMTGIRLHDVSCDFRGMRREVAQALPIYGNLHRFLPALAHKQGFRVLEIRASQHPLDAKSRSHGVTEYAARLLDIFTLFFITKFVKKPLRFFGALGAVTAFAGFVICAYLALVRLVYGVPLADRPLLLLGALLLLGGIQTFAIGLIGEIIVFNHARESKDYQIERITE